MTATIRLKSPRGQVQFQDTVDHFENGVLRLLGLERESFEYWLAVAEDEEGDSLLDRLGRAFRRMSPMGRAETLHSGDLDDGPGGVSGTLWHTSIADNRDFGVARSRDRNLAWLVAPAPDAWTRVITPPRPDHPSEWSVSSVELAPPPTSRHDWRWERARRQVRELLSTLGTARCQVLEVGTANEYFRWALLEAGATHDGIDRQLADDLEDRLAELPTQYDAIAMWDFVGRLPEPDRALSAVARRLNPGGVLAIKTPNIRCPEARLFGPHYHSLRREHLVYFAVPSLVAVAQQAGFRPVQVNTVSHLLVGFVGRNVTDQLAAEAQGSDIIAYFRKTSAS